MKEIVEKVHVPAHDVENKFYESFDGNKFADPELCMNYEKHKELEQLLLSHPLFQSKRETYIWPTYDTAYLYYISSKEYHDLLITQNTLQEPIYDDYNDFGSGFYILAIDNRSDFRSEYVLINVDHYVKCLETELDVWKDKLYALKQSVQVDTTVQVDNEDNMYGQY